MNGGNAHELGEFLKARRAELTPHSVGLRDGGQRRVPGLRREEVAALVAISTHYYTRLEQGRTQASEAVLAAIARVFRLNDDQRGYLFALAGKDSDHARPPRVQTVQPQLQRLLRDLTAVPAVILGRCTEVLAWNRLAAAMVTDFSKIPVAQRTYARLIFADPAMRSLYADWETTARMTVGHLRMAAARNAGSPQLTGLVNELSELDADFRRWWAEHHVMARTAGTKTLNHPVVGALVLEWESLTFSTDSDQELIVWTAEPGTPSHERLSLLASLAADGRESAPAQPGAGQEQASARSV